jgi:hypothetical protein
MIINQFLSLSTASRYFLSGAEISGMSSGYFLSQAMLCDNYVHTLEDSTAIGRHGGREAWWLSGGVPDCYPTVPGSNPASPQPTADCQSSGGLPPGMALGCGLTSMRSDRGEKMNRRFAKNISRKNKRFHC